jgi:peptide/nickel transport system substrate-binding protein
MQFMMNLNRFPTDNPAVRQALLYGTNREAIVDAVFQRFSPVAFGPLAATTDYYNPDVSTFFVHDDQQARDLLNAVGFSETNENGILLAPTNATTTDSGEGEAAIQGVPLKLKIVVPPWGMAPEVAQLLQSQWKTLGIDVEITQAAGYGALMDAARSGDYNLIAMHSFGRDPNLIAQYFKSGQMFNWSGYADYELDNYLDEAASTLDETLRASLYGAAQIRLMEQSVILPVRDYVNLNGAAANIEGVSFDAQGWFPLLHNFSVSTEGSN